MWHLGDPRAAFLSFDTAEAPKLSSLSVLAQCGNRVAAWSSRGIAGRQRSHHEHQPTESKDVNTDLHLAPWPNGTLQHTESRKQIPDPRERRADPLQKCRYSLSDPGSEVLKLTPSTSKTCLNWNPICAKGICPCFNRRMFMRRGSCRTKEEPFPAPWPALSPKYRHVPYQPTCIAFLLLACHSWNS